MRKKDKSKKLTPAVDWAQLTQIMQNNGLTIAENR